MGETGLLSGDDRVELVEREMMEMPPIGWRHARCVSRLTMLLARFAGDRYVVSVRNPLTISEHGEPARPRAPRGAAARASAYP